jgi:hypothetical protein
MNWEKPTPAALWAAIEVYVGLAYDTQPSSAVRARLDALRGAAPDAFFECKAFEPSPKEDPARYDLRLGNRWYPHMKLVVQRAPDGKRYLLRADTHDRHIQPAPGSREYVSFCELMEKNQSLACQIESAWEARGFATFKSFLRDDLARRRCGPPP